MTNGVGREGYCSWLSPSSSHSWVDKRCCHLDMQEMMKSRPGCVTSDSPLAVDSQLQEAVSSCICRSQAKTVGFIATDFKVPVGREDGDVVI